MRTLIPIMFGLIAVLASASQSRDLAAQPQQDSQTFVQAQMRPLAPLSTVSARRVRDLLAQMRLKEKVGQMTQLELGMITDGQAGAVRVNPDKLRKAVSEYGVGSILNVKDVALPPAKWREIIGAIEQAAAATRLKIPVIYGLDTIHGANYIAGATIFPQPLGMAATWDPSLMREASALAAAETRAVGVPWNFSPVLDVGRQPLWPRLYETFGEDPYLVSVMGVATVRGYQGDEPALGLHVAATLKHYVGYSFPASGRDRTTAIIPEKMLREVFLPPFAAAVKTGALSVMVNSGDVNGIPGHANKRLLTDVLRGELGFEGVVVSDWEDVKKLVTAHHAAPTEKDATRTAVLAGIDMSMVPSDYSFSDLLVQLVDEGAVPMSRIDEAVRRILTMKARVGLFDTSPARGSVDVGGSREVALRAARESLVLAKNDSGLLPLGPSSRILVTGPTADSLVALNNGWTITWQGDRAELYPADRPTVRSALEKALPGRVTYAPGATYNKVLDIQAAATSAASADVVVLCLGEMSYAETPGNIDDLALPDAQLQLADAIIAAGKPVVLVMIEGRPRIIRTIADRVRSILIALNPGMEGGTAIADVLSGLVNPSGRLPITYPRSSPPVSSADLTAAEGSAGPATINSQFEFGSGLGYTTFEYSALTTRSPTTTATQGVDASVTVRNTGKRSGTEVVALFLSDRSATPPLTRLRRFTRVDLLPGLSRTVTFHLSRDDLTRIGTDGRSIAMSGTVTLAIGPLTRDVIVK
jgi:beta-glucosidase